MTLVHSPRRKVNCVRRDAERTWCGNAYDSYVYGLKAKRRGECPECARAMASAEVPRVRPVLLDAFCGAGGATKGYQRAGFHVVGVDIEPQPDYCGDEFVQADAVEFLSGDLSRFSAVHASPPCQAFTRASKLRTAQGGTCSSPDLVEPVRRLVIASGLPYVIENVEGAPVEGVVLCGSMFGLKVRRHRVFESNVLLMRTTCDHRSQGRPVGVYHRMADEVPNGGRTARTLEEAQEAMGIDWMRWDELKEAIPPAYTEWVGLQLLDAVRAAA